MVSQMTKYASLDRTLGALADPTRRSILQLVSTGPTSISELARPFGIALPTVLEHVRILEETRLLTTEQVGRGTRLDRGVRVRSPCRRRVDHPVWPVLGALCRAECLPRRGEATPPRLRVDHRVAGWIARRIADGDQPSRAGWTDAPHAHATRGPLRRHGTRIHRRLERVPGRARRQDPNTARDLSRRR